jgi:mannose-6-phosphate isomerase-like protein (cupin superfamily)
MKELQPLIVGPGSDKVALPIREIWTYTKALGFQTGGAFALLEQTIPPGQGARRHVHRREEESFYILEGEFGFEVGARQFLAGPGTFVLGPRDIPHRFWNAGTTLGRLLVLLTPPGLEPFFEEFGRVLAESPGDLVRQAEVAGRYGMEFV